MARRLFWVGVGVALTVVVVRQGRRIAREYLPKGTTEVAHGVTRVSSALRTARAEFAVGMAEREEELRRELVGDADVAELRTQRPERVAALRKTFDARTGTVRTLPEDWAEEDDDGFF